MTVPLMWVIKMMFKVKMICEYLFNADSHTQDFDDPEDLDSSNNTHSSDDKDGQLRCITKWYCAN